MGEKDTLRDIAPLPRLFRRGQNVSDVIGLSSPLQGTERIMPGNYNKLARLFRLPVVRWQEN